MEIKLLDDYVQNYVKSSIKVFSFQQCVCELIHNSLDAKSSNIFVNINLATFTIRVIDNGIGIPKNNMNFIATRYMTSKCHTKEDFEKYLGTYGYKGQVLASIREMSEHLIIESRYDSETYMKEFKYKGKTSTLKEIRRRPSRGTTVTVKNFLFNAPIRRKQMKSYAILEEIKKMLQILSIRQCKVRFRLRDDCEKKMVFVSNKNNDIYGALISIYPHLDRKFFRTVTITTSNFCITGLIYLKPSLSNDLQILFVNRRRAHCTKIQKLIKCFFEESKLWKTNNMHFDSKKIQKAIEDMDLNTVDGGPDNKENCFVYVVDIKCSYSELEFILYNNKIVVEFHNWHTVVKHIEKLFENIFRKEDLIDNTKKRVDAIKEIEPETVPDLDMLEFCGNLQGKPVKRHLQVVQDSEVNCPSKKVKSFSSCLQSSGKAMLMDMFLKSCYVVAVDRSKPKAEKVFPPATPFDCSMKQIGDLTIKPHMANFAQTPKVNKRIELEKIFFVPELPKKNCRQKKSLVKSLRLESRNECTKSQICARANVGTISPYFSSNLQNNNIINSKLNLLKSESSLKSNSREFEVIVSPHFCNISNIDKSHKNVLPPDKLMTNLTITNTENFDNTYSNSLVQHGIYKDQAICVEKIINNEKNCKSTKMKIVQNTDQSIQTIEKQFFETAVQTSPLSSQKSPLNEKKYAHVGIQTYHFECSAEKGIFTSPPSRTSSPDILQNPKENIMDNLQMQSDQHEGITSILANKTEHICGEINNGEWSRIDADDGGVSYLNMRTGMTLKCTPAEVVPNACGFFMSDRKNFVPKGLSPIVKDREKVEERLSQTAKRTLHEALAKNALYELGTVKWQIYFDSQDCQRFFNNLYTMKAKDEIKSEIANVYESCKWAKKVMDNNLFYNFNKDIFENMQIIGQWDSKFIVTVLGGKYEKLVVLFDQHAVDERIKLEKLHSVYRKENKQFHSVDCAQFSIELEEKQLKVLSETKEHFEYFGLSYEIDLNSNKINVYKIPKCFYSKRERITKQTSLDGVNTLVNKFIDDELNKIIVCQGLETKNIPAVFQQVMNMEACRGALKFGEKLSRADCIVFIRNLSKCFLPFQCAHGRPTLAPIVELPCLETRKQPTLKALKKKQNSI